MPFVNVYSRNEEHQAHLVEVTDPLRDCVAAQLSTVELQLTRDEVSVRILNSLGSGMLADVEMDVAAVPFPARVERKEEICSELRSFVLEAIPGLSDAKVWLSLHEMGYSFDR